MLKILVNIFRAKVRSVLTMAGIAVGVFSVTLISTIGAVGTEQVGSTLVTMGVDTLLVQAASRSVSVTLTDSDVSEVRRIDGVTDVMPLMASMTEAKMIDRRLDCYVWGVDKSADKLISLEAEHGRLVTTADCAALSKVCVIDEQFAVEAYGRSNVVGKKLRMFLGGKYHEFTVIGVAKSGLSSLQGMLSNIMPGFMYIPITTMQQLCGRTTYDKIAVKISGEGFSPKTVTSALDRKNGHVDGYLCNNLLSQKSQLEDIMSIVTTTLSLTAGISLVVSGISVMTAMMMSVGERTREIGIKKAIGAKKRDILGEFLAESVLLTLMGSAAGIAGGLLVSFFGCVVFGVPFSADIAALVVSAATTALLGAVFGAYPAVKAAKLSPADALRM